MKRLLQLVLAAAWALVPATVLNATDLRNVLIDYSVASWTAKDGLPDGAIASIAQDRDGYLWLGGDFGLLRFDGVRFTEWDWNLIAQPALEHVRIELLCSSADGSLWIAFGDGGNIVRLHDGHASAYEGFRTEPDR